MKALIISNMEKRFLSGHRSIIDPLEELGYDVTWASNFNEYKEDLSKAPCKTIHIDFIRNPFNPKNIKAYEQLMKLLNKEKYDVLHCNSPIGGVLGRVCGKKAKISVIIYTVHGFHFYKGAPLINKTLYRWAEIWLGHYTDAIITINKEDYQAAQVFKLRKGGNIYYLPGIGIDTMSYKTLGVDKHLLRSTLGLTEQDIVLIAMGDLIQRKNYEISIRAISKADNPKLHFLICGKGPKLNELKTLVKELKLENQIHFLGYRTDIKELLQVADIFLFTTYQEGLPRSMMEAMASGLPCIASKIRGNIDLIDHGKGGYLCDPDNIDGFAKAIIKLVNDNNSRRYFGDYNLNIIKSYDTKNIKKLIKGIYGEVLKQSE